MLLLINAASGKNGCLFFRMRNANNVTLWGILTISEG